VRRASAVSFTASLSARPLGAMSGARYGPTRTPRASYFQFAPALAFPVNEGRHGVLSGAHDAGSRRGDLLGGALHSRRYKLCRWEASEACQWRRAGVSRAPRRRESVGARGRVAYACRGGGVGGLDLAFATSSCESSFRATPALPFIIVWERHRCPWDSDRKTAVAQGPTLSERSRADGHAFRGDWPPPSRA